MPACSTCGELNPERARFCLGCGAPLSLERAEARKTVTVVFTDVSGSTALAERLDPEALRRVMARFFDAMRVVLERHGGSVEKYIGDAVMAVFGVPVVHEDDALRGVRAAVEMREALAALNEDLERQWGVRIQARTGVNTGEIVTGETSERGSILVGDAVNVAARLEQGAAPGEVLVGESTYRLVRDAVRVEPVEDMELRGKDERVAVLRIIEVDPGAPGAARRTDSPMVGREGERTLLQQAFDRTVRDRTCHLFTILGSAGVGKSRLATEVMGGCRGQARVLTGRCLTYGEGITFWPVVEVVRQAAGITDEDSTDGARTKIQDVLGAEEDAVLVAERVAQVVGLTEASSETEETSWAVRRFLEALAAHQPLVVMLDDLHWAEPTLLDLVEYVAEWTRGVPILVLCLSRPDLLDQRPWGGGKVNATTILLEPLTEQESNVLIENLLGRAEVAEDVRRRIAAAAEGNPLFVEEMLSMLIDDGLLRRTDGRWEAAGDLSHVSIPPTIQALLSARLDRLDAEARSVMERASVEGKVFHRGAVAALSEEAVPDGLDERLRELVRKELLRPAEAAFAGEEAYQFRHILIREAAYRTVPKETRAELHVRFAKWLEGRVGEWVTEYEEILGYHLEQGHRYRAELGPVDGEAREVGRRAAEHLGRAGRRALDRGDLRAAVNLLERASSLVPEGDRRRLTYRLDLSDALAEMGRFSDVELLLEDISEQARAVGDRAAEWRTRMERCLLRINTDPGTVTEDARRQAEEAIRELERLNDYAGLALAWRVLAFAHWNEARAAATEEALERALHHARAAGDRRAEANDLGFLTMAASWGPAPVEEGIRRCEQVIAESGGHRAVEAAALITRGTLEARLGRVDEARAMVARGRAMLRDLGLSVMAAATTQSSGQVEMLAGDPAAAEREWRAGFDALQRIGEKGYLSTSAGYVAEALCDQGRFDEAESFARISEEAADPHDLASQILWRTARGRVLARRGDGADAERLVRDAVDLAEGTDFLETRGDALVALADVLRVLGRPEEAAEHVHRAVELFERKGNRQSARRARAMLAGTAG